jgi:hypothetical protein
MLPAGITCPTVTATLFKVSIPTLGKDEMMTDSKSLGKVSSGSEKPKSAAAKVWLPFSCTVMDLSVPDGA